MGSQDVPAVILAAGSGLRAGAPKQLLRYKGRPLLRHAVESALASRCHPVYVVLGAEADLIRREFESLLVSFVVNPEWRDGISSSISTGLCAARAVDEGVGAVLFLAADQPLVTADALDRILDRHAAGSEPIVASSYSGTMGIPALFDARFFEDLEQLSGDTGARALILESKDDVAIVECPEAAFDVDTIEDLNRLEDRD